MDRRLRHAGFGILAALLLVGARPANAGPASQTPPRQPAGQAAQNVSVDCDIFADGVHEVPILVVTGPAPGAILSPDNVVVQGAAVDCQKGRYEQGIRELEKALRSQGYTVPPA